MPLQGALFVFVFVFGSVNVLVNVLVFVLIFSRTSCDSTSDKLYAIVCL